MTRGLGIYVTIMLQNRRSESISGNLEKDMTNTLFFTSEYSSWFPLTISKKTITILIA